MSEKPAGKGSRAPRDRPKRGGAGRSPLSREAAIIIVVVAVIVIVAAAALANGSRRGLDVEEGERLQFAVSGREGGQNTSGSLIIEVTDASGSYFEVTYTTTLQNRTTQTVVDFSGASGSWGSNVAGIMDKLSGSSSAATATNETTIPTVYGIKSVTGYVITTTTQSGVGLYYQYWLDSETKCPYTAQLLYANGDTVTLTLVHTNVPEFQS